MNDAEFRRGWPVVLSCFCVAVFAWGFGFYGQSVYLAELRRLHGWSASLIAAATTFFYIGGAVLMPLVHRVLAALGPKRMLLAGTLLLGSGACVFARATVPWQMFAGGALMAAGWSTTSGTAIATTLALWFEQRRGLAISLALNGASASGFTIAPLLVQLSHTIGLRQAVPVAAFGGVVVLLPIILLCVGRPPVRARPVAAAAVTDDGRPSYQRQSQALRDPAFWSVALPFALAIAAQVGFIVHMVAFLLPRLGPAGTSLAVSAASLAAMGGRLALGTVIDRLHQRRISAFSFASQAGGLALMYLFPQAPALLYVGCVLFGLSVGNVITLPALIVQREFAGRSFGLVIGLSSAIGQFALALAPGLFGVLRDLTGGYGAMIGVCIALQLAGSIVVLAMGMPRLLIGGNVGRQT